MVVVLGVLGALLFLGGLLFVLMGSVSLAIPLAFLKIPTRRRGGEVIGVGVVLVAIGGFLIPSDPGGRSKDAAEHVTQVTPSAQPTAPDPQFAVSAYEVTDRRMLNDARIVVAKTEAPVWQLEGIARAIIAGELPDRPFMVRVIFLFPEETQVLPRYRVEWTASGTRSHDFTEERKVAGLRY